MNDWARYTFKGGSSSGGGGGGGDSGGGGGGGGPGGTTVVSAPRVLGTGNDVICTFSSEERDVQLYPNARDCVLSLPDSISSVRGIRAVAAEMPHTSFTVTKPRLYFSENHDGVWVPFFCGISSGNYGVDTFTTVLNASTLNAVCLTDEFATPRNKYDVSYSEDWGRICVAADRACDFSLQFRKAPVTVVAARINNTAAGQFVDVVISDKQADPLSVGAGVLLTFGKGLVPVACVVSAVAGAALSLTVVPSVKSVTPTATLSETGAGAGSTFLALSRADLISAFGTDVHGTEIPVATTAELLPFSGISGYDNLGDVLGFGTLQDRTIKDLGANAVAGLQSPFDDDTGAVLITTHQPHFCARNDIVRISNSGTFLDDVHQVVSAIDDTHLSVTPLTQRFVDSMPDLVVWAGADAAGDPTDSPVCFDLVDSAVVSGMSNGEFTLECSLRNKPAFDVGSFVGKKVGFAGDDLQWAYAEAAFAAITTTPGSTYPDRAILTVRYPTWLVSTASTLFERVGNALVHNFSQDNVYFPCRVISPGRFDFSRRRRYVYVGLSIDGSPVGNVMHPALAGKKLFARVPLGLGQGVVNFASRSDLDGTVLFPTALARVKDLGFTVVDASGAPYEFLGAEYSITLEFQLDDAAKN
ncbi:hypothetical protein JKP88DRAFT_272825 [Tribonema minus]|uniref:Uncharacterized protein n=1 Tax=Tribonema minus TaxID=303371 RepID=A0A835Z0M5_9STRA|nr:hypothetical protein JKP88DRAFT_272825 [Tribonema minus]